MANEDTGPRRGIEGVVEDVKGRAKEAAGALTGDEELRREGRSQQEKADAERDVAKAEAEAEAQRDLVMISWVHRIDPGAVVGTPSKRTNLRRQRRCPPVEECSCRFGGMTSFMLDMRKRLSHLPTRLAAGSYILNSGLTKLDSDDERAKQVHSAASGVYPAVRHTDPRTFTTALGVSEVTLGGALLLPVVPARVAGLALGAFATGLLGLYVKTPSMTRGSGLRPSENGMALAKDVWLMGMALSLIVDGSRSKRGRSRK